MATGSPPPEGHNNTLSLLNTAIGGLGHAGEISSITPAKAVFGSTEVLLTTIRVRPLL